VDKQHWYFGAVDKSVERRAKLTPFHGLIHGSLLIHIIHGLFYSDERRSIKLADIMLNMVLTLCLPHVQNICV